MSNIGFALFHRTNRCRMYMWGGAIKIGARPGAREQGVLRVYNYILYIIIYCIFILEYLGFDQLLEFQSLHKVKC